MQLLDPAQLGFQPLAIARDRFQLAFVRAVMLDVGAVPEGLPDLVSKEQLQAFAGGVWGKVGGIEYNAFRTELLPFVGQADAEGVTEAVWGAWCADVANAVERICHGLTA